jgi:hypothetical protein
MPRWFSVRQVINPVERVLINFSFRKPSIRSAKQYSNFPRLVIIVDTNVTQEPTQALRVGTSF